MDFSSMDAASSSPPRLLLAADLHIGRRSTRLGAAGDTAPTAVAAWDRLVELALAEQVSLVCLAGDIADGANRFFEALGPLERGLARLSEAGIRTVAVAGNHDHQVLARLADQLDPNAFTLLGRGGLWEQLPVELADGQRINLVGWSFPESQVRRDPTADFPARLEADAPALGLLHGEPNQPESPYAPLDPARLKQQPVAGWVIGHIHQPGLDQQPGEPFILQPGSPQALDPGEWGLHGVWLCQRNASTLTRPHQRPLSTVRYETVPVDLTGAAEPGDFESAVIQELDQRAAPAAAESAPALEHLALRIVLRGRTALHSRLPRLSSELTEGLQRPCGQAVARVEKVLCQTLPDIDLAQQAEGNTPAAELARLMLALERDEPDQATARLIQQATERLRQVHSRKDYWGLPADETDETTQAKAHLQDQARALLGQLLLQQEPAES
jgi:DNA repair exonuclease SbcCD nuclease subunit